MAQHTSSVADKQSAHASAAVLPEARFPSPFRVGRGLAERWRAKALLILAATMASMQIDLMINGDNPRHWLPICLLHSFIYSVCIGLLLLYSLSFCGPYVARRSFPLNWALLFLSILVPSAIGTMLSGLLLIALGLHPPGDFSKLTVHSLQLTLLLSLIFGISFYLYENLRGELEATTLQLRTKQLEEERARKLAIAAQLSSIESRVRPHFFFNTLNSISALIRQNPERAERMVEQLSALLRFSLDANRRSTVPLRDEVKLATDYLEIEKIRFGERLRFNIAVPPEFGALAVPPFTLQTLIENSVKYAVAPRRAGGAIGVTARPENGAVKLEVRDDGPGFTAEAIAAGHGLDNLQARLAALFADQASLDIQADGQCTAVTITLPRS